MTEERRKRLIEVAFPLEEVSAHARIDKYRSSPHPQTFHPWWARRPLPACRAFIYASLVDDPEDDLQRDELLKEVADVASWDTLRHPDKVVRDRENGGSGLTGTQLLERARTRILECNNGRPPRFLDPFGGGGAIPLEALRLGCDIQATDINPVATLILKACVKYPQMYGHASHQDPPAYILEASSDSTQSSFNEGDLVEAYRKNPLAADVSYWGYRVIDKVREELTQFYPTSPDNSVPITFIWCRVIECPNCGFEVPLLHSNILGEEGDQRVIVKPEFARSERKLRFPLIRIDKGESTENYRTSAGGNAVCLSCNQVTKAKEVRELLSQSSVDGVMVAAVEVRPNIQGKRFREILQADLDAYRAAGKKSEDLSSTDVDGFVVIPDEEITPGTLGVRVGGYGVNKWSQLFNYRQILLMVKLTNSVRDACLQMREEGLDDEYITGVSTYLGCMISRVARENNTFCTWNPAGLKSQGIFSQPKLSMVWDFAEVNPFAGSVGDISSQLDIIVDDISASPEGRPGSVYSHDASLAHDNEFDICLTDPPYYNALDYAGLSDFFYVWLKRAIREWHPDLFELPLTPKTKQAIMRSERNDPNERSRYVQLMADSFLAMSRAVPTNSSIGVVFAHSDPDAWATLIESLIKSELLPVASWPIDTESRTKIANLGQARLQTSVWMACRRREEDAAEAFIGDVLEAMRPLVRERLLYFWSKNIRGADFFISAIGPALSVFGRHSRVLRPDGGEVSVRDFLDIVRRESTDVALEQVLSGADLGLVDLLTRQYVTWVWSYSRAPLDAGEAIALCLATGTPYQDVVQPQSIAAEGKDKSKKTVKLRSIRERALEDDDFGTGTAALPATLIEQLQHAAWQWGQNRTDRLGAFRGTLGESRWAALHTLGQAVAACLPEGDEDRRIILGLLGSNVVSVVPTEANSGNRQTRTAPAGAPLPGFEDTEEENG